jgi:hypothetical protein
MRLGFVAQDAPRHMRTPELIQKLVPGLGDGGVSRIECEVLNCGFHAD